jgi:hypothetical protein
MVDLSSGTEGLIEHRFDNWIFIAPAIIIIVLVSKYSVNKKLIFYLSSKLIWIVK